MGLTLAKRNKLSHPSRAKRLLSLYGRAPSSDGRRLPRRGAGGYHERLLRPGAENRLLASIGLLVLLGFAVADFTPAAYQRHRL